MHVRWLGLVVVALLLSDARADKESLGKGFWKILVKRGAKWVLHDTISEDKDKATITVETYDVRKVAGAEVARLRWTLRRGKDTHDVGDSASGRYTQLAVTPAGLYILSKDMDDAKVATALKKKPSRSDPPKEYQGTKQNQGRFLSIREGLVCMGEGPRPGDGDCPDTCEGEVCISDTEGVVELSGMWAPGVTIFKQ